MTDRDREEIQQMIKEAVDLAMDKHNKSAALISSILGVILLAFYSHGVITLVGRN